MCAEPCWFIWLNRLVVVSVCLFSLPLQAVEQTVLSTEAPTWSMDRLHDQRDPAGIRIVHLSNLWGDIRLRRSENGLLELHAVVQNQGGASKGVRLNSRLQNGQFSWQLLWRDGVQQPMADRRVDLVLWVPPGPAVDLQVETGVLRMKHALENTLKVRSESSDLWLKARGDVDAWSARGRVELLSQVPDTRNSSQKLASSTGQVKLVFNQQQDIRIQILTAGDLLTDLPAILKPVQQGRYQLIQRGSSRHLYELQGDSADILLVYRQWLEPPP